MTTPERLRRRQLIEGVVLILLGVSMLLQSAYFAGQDSKQQDCLEGNFAALSKALDVRSNLTSEDSENTRAVIEAVAEATTADDVERAFATYAAEQARIDRVREQNPLPPYPAGSCGESD